MQNINKRRKNQIVLKEFLPEANEKQNNPAIESHIEKSAI